MKDENQRGSGVDRTEAPKLQHDNDGSAHNKNGAQRQEGSGDPLGFDNALRFLTDEAKPGRYSVQQIFAITKNQFHAYETDIIAAAEALDFFEEPDTINVHDTKLSLREEVQAALDVTPSDDYATWFEIGCALHKFFGPEIGFASTSPPFSIGRRNTTVHTGGKIWMDLGVSKIDTRYTMLETISTTVEHTMIERRHTMVLTRNTKVILLSN
jgi:hypothetical protein